MSNEYEVTWKIDTSADTPEQAAKEVFEDCFSHHDADFFTVTNTATGETTEVNAND